MINFNPRMASFVLAFGIFFTLSCSTLLPTQKTSDELIKEQKFNEALNLVNESIRDNPDNNELRLQKASILYLIARDTDTISERKPTYLNLRTTVDDLNSTTETYRDSSNNILIEAWSFEQSEGLRYLQQEDTDTYDRYFDRITAHLTNAITIMPDSMSAYSLLSTTYYRHGDTQLALNTIREAVNKSENPPNAILEKKAFLHLETGNIEESLRLYKTLAENDSSDGRYRRGLVNVLILNEDHTQAIEILENLVEQFPTRPDYLEALATQTYYLAEKQMLSIIEESSNGETSNEKLTEVIDHLKRAESYYSDLDLQGLNSEDRIYRIAQFYTSSAQILNRLDDVNSSESVASLSYEFLNSSLPYWRELTESNPDNLTYRNSLYDIYVKLDMTEEATRLDQQINY